jgi:hypothetical protein
LGRAGRFDARQNQGDSSARSCPSALSFHDFLTKKAQQFGIDLLCVSPDDAVRPSFHDVQPSAFDEFGGALSCRCERHNPVGVTVNNERRHIHTSQILPEVLMPCWNACQAGGRLSASRH